MEESFKRHWGVRWKDSRRWGRAYIGFTRTIVRTHLWSTAESHSHLRRVTVWDPVESGKHTVIPLTWLWVMQQGLQQTVVQVAHCTRVPSSRDAAAAAKSLQSCLTLCDPIDGSPPGSPVPGILQARTPEWVAISFSNAWKWKVKVKSLSRVWLLATPGTAARQAPPPMGFSRQEYWSGVPLPSPAQGMRGT